MSSEYPEPHGALGGDSLVSLLCRVADRFRRGALIVRAKDLHDGRPPRTVRIELHDGDVRRVEASGREPEKRIGTMLLRAGLMERRDLENALREQATTEMLLGSILVRQGILSSRDLEQLLRLQSNETLRDTLVWTEAQYWFEPASIQPPAENQPVISLPDAILEAMRWAEDRSVLRRRMPAPFATLEKIPAQSSRHRNFFLDPLSTQSWFEHQRIIHDLITPGRTLREIMDRSRLGEMEASQAVLMLLETGAAMVVGDVRPQNAYQDFKALGAFAARIPGPHDLTKLESLLFHTWQFVDAQIHQQNRSTRDEQWHLRISDVGAQFQTRWRDYRLGHRHKGRTDVEILEWALERASELGRDAAGTVDFLHEIEELERSGDFAVRREFVVRKPSGPETSKVRKAFLRGKLGARLARLKLDAHTATAAAILETLETEGARAAKDEPMLKTSRSKPQSKEEGLAALEAIRSHVENEIGRVERNLKSEYLRAEKWMEKAEVAAGADLRAEALAFVKDALDRSKQHKENLRGLEATLRKVRLAGQLLDPESGQKVEGEKSRGSAPRS